jgi:hypothetical protein
MRNTASGTDKAELTRPNEDVRGQEASRNRPETSRGDEKNLAPGATKKLRAESGDGVPAFRKRNQRPCRFVVVGGLRQLIESRRVGQEVLLRRGRNGRSHGIQQTIELNFTHHALRVRERTISEYFSAQIEMIDQIVSIRQSERTWLPILIRGSRVGRPDPS